MEKSHSFLLLLLVHLIFCTVCYSQEQEGDGVRGLCFIQTTNGWFTVCEFPTNNVKSLARWRGVLISAEAVKNLPKDDLIRIGGGENQSASDIGKPQEFGDFVKPPSSFFKISHRTLPPKIQDIDPPFKSRINEKGVVQVGFGCGHVFFVVDEIQDMPTAKQNTTDSYDNVVRIDSPAERKEDLRAFIEKHTKLKVEKKE